ncbi:septation protein SepH [Ancrocorticia sp.]|uniref:septation protein SepH n=1 Tax=Ancrocorticia sp. TaxID=2593684 RepID=UPI003F935C91
MITLELLGLQADGEHLTLNDAEGNRYSLAISDDLRAALRRDIRPAASPEDARHVSPREIQAMIREGMSVEEVCEVSSLPAARVSVLAYPIFAEREHLVRRATAIVQGREVGSLTVEELITSRLVARGVPADAITWDATRKSHNPWVLRASFTENGEEHTAMWRVDLERKNIEARNPDAQALSEKQIEQPAEPDRSPRIDDVLATLDSQRGQSRPMPSFDELEDVPEPEVAGSHPDGDPTYSEAASPHVLPGESAETSDMTTGTPSESAKHKRALSVAQPLSDELFDPAEEDKAHHPAGSRTTRTRSDDSKKKRGNRPEMPSWDEIVFGKKD